MLPFFKQQKKEPRLPASLLIQTDGEKKGKTRIIIKYNRRLFFFVLFFCRKRNWFESPSKNLRDTDGVPPQTKAHRDQSDDQIHDAQHRGAHHEARIEDAVEHEMASQMAGPHGGRQVDGGVV